MLKQLEHQGMTAYYSCK